MAKCDICGKEGNVTNQTFSADTGIDAINLCRKCQGRLILSLPKSATPAQIKKAINSLYDKVEEEKSHKYRR